MPNPKNAPKAPEKKIKKISIKGAREHNLQNINVEIPRNKFVVITGLSGSGKSSLAFDTLYAEGQRRYVESLSSYARQFLGKIHKPEVDYIKGIPPAIAIEQKVNTRNPRSTVGTSTEIYDYIKLLYARIGKTYSPISGKLVKRHSVSDVVNFICSFPSTARATILSPLVEHLERSMAEQLDILQKQGFSRIEITDSGKEVVFKISEITGKTDLISSTSEVSILIDRFQIGEDEDTMSRMADSVQTAFYEGHGDCKVKIYHEDKEIIEVFSNKFETDGLVFEDPSVNMFSFNNPLGACPTCEGFGSVIGIDEDLVIPNKTLSIFQEAVACWRGDKMQFWKDQLIQWSSKFDFPIHRAYNKLSEKEKSILWKGNQYFEGLDSFFKMLERENYKIQYRVMLSRYRGKTFCPDCKGTRLKKEAGYVKIADTSIHDLVILPIDELSIFFDEIQLNENDKKISKRLLLEISNRIKFLVNVGLGYLTLNRLSSSLSGGESQRINLATSLGSSLVGSLYVLDEPSIGLHSRDTEKLIGVLKQLQSLGNTVVVVEHDEDIIRAADEIIDLGPEAGRLGGHLVFQGSFDEINDSTNSLTADYLTGKKKIALPKRRRKSTKFIEIINAHENNLKNIDVKIPLNIFTVITGVSGSGKSSLVRDILYAGICKQLNGYADKVGKFDQIKGHLESVHAIEFVDQNPIGRSSRSNPVTYIKAYDEIRKLYSEQQLSVIMGFKPAHFSFNVEGGRCEECVGEGQIKVEMQFMADVHLECESCKGKRFKQEVLDVLFTGKSIYDILELTIDDAIDFFRSSGQKKIADKLMPLANVGLGYVKLGQSSSTLSGGESQRIKLASFLTKESEKKSTLFIFDEPTTGLHFHDIRKLLDAFYALIDNGHSIVLIEHNPDVIKCADWIIDLGKEGGKNGGYLVFEGTPENLIKCKDSYTAKYLESKILDL